MVITIAGAVCIAVRLEHQVYGLQMSCAATRAEVQVARESVPNTARDTAGTLSIRYPVVIYRVDERGR